MAEEARQILREVPRYSDQELDRVIPDGGIDPKKKIRWRPQDYTTSNVTTSRTLDADGGDIDALSDVVATLIADLQELRILK